MKVIKSNDRCVVYTTAPRVSYTSNGFVVATFDLSAKIHSQEELERFIEAVTNVGEAMNVGEDEQKYECHLEYCAECDTSGSMMLTKEEYETVKRVANTDNWNNLKWSPFSGILLIWCDDLELRGDDHETD